MTEGILKEVVGDEEAFKSTADKMASFRAGYGTVLFFEDNNVIAGSAAKLCRLCRQLPGMVQPIQRHAICSMDIPEAEGLGASLHTTR